LDIRPYAPALQPSWDAFVRSARNGTFLFERGYMDYHADRFEDASLMLWQDDELRAVLPASRKGTEVTSHGGLTFGGLVLHGSVGAQQTLEMTEQLAHALRERGAKRLVYKPVPHIFHRQPSEDDLYALHRLGARTVRMDVSTTIDLSRRLPWSSQRRRALGRAHRAGVNVERCTDRLRHERYWQLLAEVLAERHGVAPAHSVDEILRLASGFPQIALHCALRDTEVLAGVLSYRYDGVLHTQYLCTSPEGREVGALDAVIADLLEQECDGLRWLNFGVSTFDQGRQLNPGLVAQKEMFGGRSTVHQVLELDLTGDLQ
jgi:hypothetical protein